MLQILLRGANGDELKKVKHVVQYGIFAAYHLALETSFLADEGASLPELSLNSPINVALPDKPSSMDRSISIVPGFTVGQQESQPSDDAQKSNCVPPQTSATFLQMEMASSPSLPNGPNLQYTQPISNSINSSAFSFRPSSKQEVSDSGHCNILPCHAFEDTKLDSLESLEVMGFASNVGEAFMYDHLIFRDCESLETLAEGTVANSSQNYYDATVTDQLGTSEMISMQQDIKNHHEEPRSSKEEFPPSPSDHQSILVSLSSRCVWKGTVCERSHLFRIKYYGNFDKPLGRFLRDHLFDQVLFLSCIFTLSVENLQRNVRLRKLFIIRVSVAVLVRCHQKRMFIVILIDKVPSQFP